MGAGPQFVWLKPEARAAHGRLHDQNLRWLQARSRYGKAGKADIVCQRPGRRWSDTEIVAAFGKMVATVSGRSGGCVLI